MKHLSQQPSTGYADYIHASNRQCPLCAAYLLRTPRRPVDRLWSIFKPVLRYRCQRFACQWQGNLTQANAGRDAAPRGSASGNGPVRARRSKEVPMAFIAHIVLAVSGGLLVIVVGNSDPTVVREVAWTALGQDSGPDSASNSSGTQSYLPASQRARTNAGPGVADTTIREPARN